MTQPKHAHQTKLNHYETTRIYKIDGREYPSVTSIISMMDKPALVPWAAKMAAQYAIEHHQPLGELPPEDAIQAIKSNWRKQRDRAADFGTAVHQYIEHGIMPDPGERAHNYVQAARNFILEHDLLVERSEATVYHPGYGYAGTVDLITTSGYYIDWKTGKGLYFDSHGMQLAALMSCTHIIGNDLKLNPRAGIAVRLKPDATWESKTITYRSETHQALLAAFIGLTDVWQLKRNQHTWENTL